MDMEDPNGGAAMADVVAGCFESSKFVENYEVFETTSRSFSFSNRITALDRLQTSNLSCSSDGCLPVDFYFDALQEPELEIPKVPLFLTALLDEVDPLLLLMERESEKLIQVRWPFLLRFPITTFGITLGMGSQTVLWKNMSSVPSVAFLHVPSEINVILWCLALLSYSIIFFIYTLKVVFYFEAVRREYFHPIRINYFFAPWIAGMLLAIGIPPIVTKTIHPIIWVVLMVPLLLLEVKIYGQWMSRGERRLSKVANPTTQIAIVGNFVAASLGALVGWKQLALFAWAIGIPHYLVVLLTLYQRLPTNDSISVDLHPSLFLFVAPPSIASLAWEAIFDNFDVVSEVTYMFASFILLLLVVRINIFRGYRFSMAWWAYSFPSAAISLATLHYSNRVTSTFTQGLTILISFTSTLVFFSLLTLTILHWFFWKTLFLNDMAIAVKGPINNAQ